MSIISAGELSEQAELVYVRGTYYVTLLYSATSFDSTVDYADITANELTVGVGGYDRVSFTYTSADLLDYSNGQPLGQKTANFVHDGSSDSLTFTHVALIREISSVYTVVAIEELGDIAILDSGNTAAIAVNVLHGKI